MVYSGLKFPEVKIFKHLTKCNEIPRGWMTCLEKDKITYVKSQFVIDDNTCLRGLYLRHDREHATTNTAQLNHNTNM